MTFLSFFYFLPDMALAAHNGAFFIFVMASFAVRMECFFQAQLVPGAFLLMTL
jgi:hypothetical protein